MPLLTILGCEGAGAGAGRGDCTGTTVNVREAYPGLLSQQCSLRCGNLARAWLSVMQADEAKRSDAPIMMATTGISIMRVDIVTDDTNPTLEGFIRLDATKIGH